MRTNTEVGDDMTIQLPQGAFSRIVADPNWRHGSQAEAKRRAAGEPANVKDMSVDDLCALPVKEHAAKDALCFLWISNLFLIDGSGLRVLDAWGFEPVALITWAKTKSSNGLEPSMKTGHWIRGATEHILIGSRGEPERPRSYPSIASWWAEPRIATTERRPDKLYEIVDATCSEGDTKLELFSLHTRKGWTTWGPNLSSAPIEKKDAEDDDRQLDMPFASDPAGEGGAESAGAASAAAPKEPAPTPSASSDLHDPSPKGIADIIAAAAQAAQSAAEAASAAVDVIEKSNTVPTALTPEVTTESPASAEGAQHPAEPETQWLHQEFVKAVEGQVGDNTPLPVSQPKKVICVEMMFGWVCAPGCNGVEHVR